METGSLKPSKEAIEAAMRVETGIGQGASYDHTRYIYINAVLEAAYAIDFAVKYSPLSRGDTNDSKGEFT